MTVFANRPPGAEPPPGFAPWCLTLRGEQAWQIEIDGGRTGLDTWRALRDRHPRTGLWPVLLGGDAQEADQLTWRLDLLARNAPGIPDLAALPAAPDLFEQWLGDPSKDDYLHDIPRHLAKLEADAAMIRERIGQRPDEAAVRALAGPRTLLGLVPARHAWEVPALLAWAGAERRDIAGPEHLAVLSFWQEQYGAEVVAMGLERLEFLITDPPEDTRSVFGLAVQQYAYCPELMDNVAPAMGALAATLFGRHWIFDWS